MYGKGPYYVFLGLFAKLLCTTLFFGKILVSHSIDVWVLYFFIMASYSILLDLDKQLSGFMSL